MFFQEFSAYVFIRFDFYGVNLFFCFDPSEMILFDERHCLVSTRISSIKLKSVSSVIFKVVGLNTLWALNLQSDLLVGTGVQENHFRARTSRL